MDNRGFEHNDESKGVHFFVTLIGKGNAGTLNKAVLTPHAALSYWPDVTLIRDFHAFWPLMFLFSNLQPFRDPNMHY